MSVLIALGGNALLPRGEAPDAATQIARIEQVAPRLAEVARTHDLVITHGNGPQVGLLATESADDRSLSRPYPFDALVAETQGLIGYWLQRSLREAGLHRVVTVITQTRVDPLDPAFQAPTKYVGATMSEREATRLAAERGWTVRADGESWRRVVPSPAPQAVLEAPIIQQLVESGTTVICAGGGGSPVAVSGDSLLGVEAVIDKDAVAALLAIELGVHRLILLTDVAAVIDGFGTAHEQPLASVTVADMERRRFPAGSMGPKVDAACRFVRSTGLTAAIGALDDLSEIIAGSTGTHVTSG